MFAYHLVTVSPWPLLLGFSVLSTAIQTAGYFNEVTESPANLGITLLIVTVSMICWFKDVVREGTYLGNHTLLVQQGLKYGMILFIVSEVLFFTGFFWTYFHAAIAPNIELGSLWPPQGIAVLSPLEVPLLNTILLLTSGILATWGHHALKNKDYVETRNALIITIVLGLIFTGYQALEYEEAMFTIADSVYGSIFFLATGFHGMHVIVGTALIIGSLVRVLLNHFTWNHHVGLEAALWYWHFVDVVWIFLYIFVYLWGNW